jgi:hypothetical protein
MTATDALLLASHVFLMIDLSFDWGTFAGCKRPVNYWLFVSYGLMLFSRLVFLIGAWRAGRDTGHFLLNGRPKDMTSKFIFSLTWILVPFTAMWNLTGTFWFYEVRMYSPRCMPISSNHFWIMIVWQILSYGWVIVHTRIAFVAWMLERRLRSVEDGLRQVADEDMLSRWGNTAERIQDYTALRGATEGTGMSPAEIHALPSQEFSGCSSEECSICLTEVDAGDQVRELTCKHVFHRACIDLWLLRNSCCPLCKCCQKQECAVESQVSPTLPLPSPQNSLNAAAATVVGALRLRSSTRPVLSPETVIV